MAILLVILKKIDGCFPAPKVGCRMTGLDRQHQFAGREPNGLSLDAQT
ncbi:MAG: hypothetical protein QE285_06650 [Aquabacterium sp.]|nr:hypothetical protein [Aquabacterium sp.]